MKRSAGDTVPSRESRLAASGKEGEHARPVARLAAHLEAATEQGRPLGHPEQAEVVAAIRARVQRRPTGAALPEAAAVVGDRQLESAVDEAGADPQRAGGGVDDGVADRLLGDPEG